MPLNEEECKNIDNPDKLTNVNDVLNCVIPNSLIGLPSDSASPSDTCLISFNPNTKLNELKLSKGFIKYYVTDTSGIPIQYINEINALKYETVIYKWVRRLTTYGVNGHFVKVLGGADGINFDTMSKFLSTYSGMSQKDIDRNLYRNSNFMTFALSSARPAITENKVYKPLPLSEDKVHKFKYAFILTEGLTIDKLPYNNPTKETEITDNLHKLYNLSIGSCLRFHDMIAINTHFQRILGFTPNPSLEHAEKTFHTYLISVLFQACTACYSLYINGIAHNDLHSGNVLVRKIPYTLLKYNVIETGKTYFVFSHFFAKIFDWDRSFSINVGKNNILNSPVLFKANQTNDLIEQRDFIKLLCYLYKSFYVQNGSKVQLTNIFITKKLLNAVIKLKPSGVEFNPQKYDVDTRTVTSDWWVNYKRKDKFLHGKGEEYEFQDFWEQIFIRNRKCLLNSDFIDGINPEIFKTTLYSLPEIMDNLYNMKDEKKKFYYIQRDPDPRFPIYQNIISNMRKL